MGIEAKDTNIIVTSKHSVLISDVADEVTRNKSIEWLQRRFPVTEAEIFEIIDFYADKFDEHDETSIDLQNIGNAVDIDLECKSVSDGMFFNILSYGKQFFPNENRFPMLFKYGLHTIVIECMTDIKNGNKDFESSSMHVAVYDTIKEIVSELSPDEIINSLNEDMVNLQ